MEYSLLHHQSLREPESYPLSNMEMSGGWSLRDLQDTQFQGGPSPSEVHISGMVAQPMSRFSTASNAYEDPLFTTMPQEGHENIGAFGPLFYQVPRYARAYWAIDTPKSLKPLIPSIHDSNPVPIYDYHSTSQQDALPHRHHNVIPYWVPMDTTPQNTIIAPDHEGLLRHIDIPTSVTDLFDSQFAFTAPLIPTRHSRTESGDNSPSQSSSSDSSAAVVSASSTSKRYRIPRITPSNCYSPLSRHHGVFCDPIFVCKWAECNAVLERSGGTEEHEDNFQRGVRGHINKHVKASGEFGCESRACRWEGCNSAGTLKEERTLRRHIQSHTGAWHFFCRGCPKTGPRKCSKHNPGLKMTAGVRRPTNTNEAFISEA